MYIIRKFLQDIKQHKDLIYYLTLSDLKANTARTYFGFLWWILDPILYMSVFYLLVEVILQRGGEGYAVFLFVALIPLKWTISSLVDSTKVIAANQRIIQQVYVPKIVFILTSLLVNTFKFVVGSVVLLLFLLAFRVDLSVMVLTYTVIVFVQLIFLAGCMVVLAHIGAFLKDVRNLMQYIARMLFFLSPVLYSIESVPEKVRFFIYLNPMTSLINSYRNVLLYQQAPEWLHLFILLVVGIFILYVGLKLVFKYEKHYAKVI